MPLTPAHTLPGMGTHLSTRAFSVLSDWSVMVDGVSTPLAATRRVRPVSGITVHPRPMGRHPLQVGSRRQLELTLVS